MSTNKIRLKTDIFFFVIGKSTRFFIQLTFILFYAYILNYQHIFVLYVTFKCRKLCDKKKGAVNKKISKFFIATLPRST